MRTKFISALLASAFIPLVAYAQDTAPAPAQPPAAEAPAPDAPAPAATPPAETPPAGAADTSAGETPPPAMGTEPPAAATNMDAGTASEPAPEPNATEAMPQADQPDTAADASAGASSTAIEGPFVTVPPTGAWRASDLEGKSVYDADDQDIGSISDTLVDESGKVIAVLVGVGGFLGIGEKDVAVAMGSLEFGPGATEGLAAAPAAGSSDTAASGGAATPAPSGGAASGGAATTETAAPMEPPVVGEDNLPDRIVLNVTRDELQSAPAYGETDDSSSAGDTGTMGAAPGGAAPAPAPAQ